MSSGVLLIIISFNLVGAGLFGLSVIRREGLIFLYRFCPYVARQYCAMPLQPVRGWVNRAIKPLVEEIFLRGIATILIMTQVSSVKVAGVILFSVLLWVRIHWYQMQNASIAIKLIHSLFFVGYYVIYETLWLIPQIVWPHSPYPLIIQYDGTPIQIPDMIILGGIVASLTHYLHNYFIHHVPYYYMWRNAPCTTFHAPHNLH